MATKTKAQADLVAAEDAIGPDARDRVPFAGLLAHEPELSTAKHTREEWQQKLTAYLHPNDVSEENHAD